MLITIFVSLALSFLFYVCAFGGSSTGFIGRLHRGLTRCECFAACCGDRCLRFMQRTEEVCCLRPNPLLQLFYLSLVLGGFVLFLSSSFPLVATTPQLGGWHQYTPWPAVSVGLASFLLACYCDPGAITAANLHRYSREPYDGVVSRDYCPTQSPAVFCREIRDHWKRVGLLGEPAVGVGHGADALAGIIMSGEARFLGETGVRLLGESAVGVGHSAPFGIAFLVAARMHCRFAVTRVRFQLLHSMHKLCMHI